MAAALELSSRWSSGLTDSSADSISPNGLQASSPDAAVVRAARRGDRSALGRLHDRYAGMVHAILLSLVPARDAEDLVQDVFLTAIQRLNSLRDDNTFGAWLATIARNRASDLHRSAHVTEPLPAGLADRRRGGDASGDEADLLDIVRSLPPAYRETLLMRFVEGMSGPEIAARTGLTEGSVRVNLHRGMQLLKDRISAGNNP